MSDDNVIEPLEVAAVRRLLTMLAKDSVGEAAVEQMNPVEKADAIRERLNDAERLAEEASRRTYLITLFSSDGASKRARKVDVMDHLIEKAEQTRSGKSHIDTGTAAAVAECSDRQARTYLDELAEEVPGCHLKTPDEVGAGKQLRIDVETFHQASPQAEALPPREEA